MQICRHANVISTAGLARLARLTRLTRLGRYEVFCDDAVWLIPGTAEKRSNKGGQKLTIDVMSS